jgi:xanthine dehydrogenase accessory factor
MDCSIPQLLPAFDAARARGIPLVLATLVGTTGSTYRKPGAQLLIMPDGTCAGLLSGGCLEPDLAARAQSTLETGAAQLVRYVNSGADDRLWGLGSGCEGSLDILLTRLDPSLGWHPLSALADALAARLPCPWAAVLVSDRPELPLGTYVLRDGAGGRDRARHPELDWIDAQLDEVIATSRSTRVAMPGAGLEVFVSRVVLPPRLLVLGAGPDAVPVVRFAAMLGWDVTVADHRPALADPERFPEARHVRLGRPADCLATLPDGVAEAAVIMSHHLETDLGWLRALAVSHVPYVGLLGPASRRQQLLDELGDDARALGDRLHAPVGLDLGGRDPPSIALAIVAEIQAHLHGRGSGSVDWSTLGER